VKRITVAAFLWGSIGIVTLALSGCGGTSSSQPISVGLTSNGSASGIDQAQTITITATIANDAKNAGVTWSLSSANGSPGSLSAQTTTSVTYNAPASVTSAFTVTITATSITDPTKSASLQLKVSPPPAITTTSVPAATVAVAYSTTLTESGGTGPFNWTITSGTLPAGLSLNFSTGAITGTPTVATIVSVTFQLKDAAGMTASRTLTFTVNPPPPLTIATASLPGAELGVPYNQTLQATGGVPPYKWSVTAGSLPAGLSLSSAGVISGTPSGTAGTANFTVTVTDSETPTAATKTANLSIVVIKPPLSITTTSLAGGSIGAAYNQSLQAIGGTPPYTWSISAGTLPTGLTLNKNTGAITGSPTATGTSSFTVKVTDSATPTPGTATAVLGISINATLAITTTSLAGGNVSAVYGATVTATGGVQPYTWSVSSGSLPAGLTLNSGSGLISGTPTAAGTSNFTITVADSESPAVKANAELSITIAAASCPNNSTLTGHYAMVLNGWSNPTTLSAAAGSFVADGAGNISSGNLDLNSQASGPSSGTFTGKYCVASNNLATINLTYGGALTGNNTFAAALNSGGTNGNIIFYDTSDLKASGLLRQQDSSAFSTSKIDGNYAFGLVGAGVGGRYAMAGAFSATGSANLTGEFDNDIYGSGAANGTLSSSNFSVASTGRGTATITFTGQSSLKFVFYVVSASELLVIEADSTGNPLLTGRALEQSGTFTDASLNGVGVLEEESLYGGIEPSATAGLATTNGAGLISLSADQNQAGTMSALTLSGTYSTSSDGRVTLAWSGQANPPVLYLVGPNQAFVVGTDNFSVDSGVIEAQSGSNFTNSSLTGAYLGGSLPPVSANVGEAVDAVELDGAGNLTGTSDDNGSQGTSAMSLAGTYAVSSNGRAVVSASGAQIGIIYVISDSQIVFLPASTTDIDPALSRYQH
jgi:Putative Ig domain